MSNKLKRINFKRDSSFRYTDKFVEKFITEFTKKGDKILDPFAGFGTTLLAAQKLGRIGTGIEYDKERYNYVKTRLKYPTKVILGNSLKISSYNLPKFDFSITSPPYMRHFDKENPFSNYTRAGTYTQYLKDIRKIYSQVKKIMKKDAAVVVEVSNTFGKDHSMTTLAFDIAKEISKSFYFEREFIYCVKEGELKPGLANHSYVLLFRNR